jgi:Na+(H+)/acetate symporter ActP
MQLSRLTTVIWGAVLLTVAVFLCLHPAGRVVELGLQIAAISYGALLGVFLLGVLTKRANQNGAIIGMLCGFSTEVYLWRGTHVPFTWYVVIGTTVTFVIGYLASTIWYRFGGQGTQMSRS